MSSRPSDSCRPLWVESSAAALRANYAHLQRAAGSIPVLAVVKANAYGHGAAGCAPVLAAAGAPWLGVTDVCEGLAVRRALGILPQTVQPRILVMCGIWPGDEAACTQHSLTPVVWDAAHLHLLQAEAARRGMPPHSLAVHLEIDTGMARQGVAPGQPLADLMHHFAAATHLRVEGVLTHFASAENPDDPQNADQRSAFLQALRQILGTGARPEIVHAGNTSGIDTGIAPWLLEAADLAGATPLARAGLALYGHAVPLAGAAELHQNLQQLTPVLAWKTCICSVRDVPPGATIGYNATFSAPAPMRLALLPVGYADGFRRALSSTDTQAGGAVLIRGQRAPVLGRVSMDLTVVDVTAIPAAIPGDEVVLLGALGRESIRPEDHAALADTSVYEILCGIGARVPRTVVD